MIFKKKKYQRHFIVIFALFVYMSMVFGFTVSQVMQRGQQWSQVLNSSATVELPLKANLSDSIKTIRSIAGVKVVKSMSEKEKKDILSRWLEGVDLSRMPIVNIVEVKISEEKAVSDLKIDIEKLIKGSKIYSNMDWGKDIFELTQAIFYMCIFLFSLIIVVAVVLINFMIKSLLNSYSKEIDILALNGANDAFISAMLQKNIFIQSIKASFIGVMLANITWFVLSLFFSINYSFSAGNLINGCLIILVVSTIASTLVKFNVEKELRL